MAKELRYCQLCKSYVEDQSLCPDGVPHVFDQYAPDDCAFEVKR